MKAHITLCVAIVVAAAIMASGMTKIVKQDRSVTVRGLAEREVDADLAFWPITFTVGSNDLLRIQSETVKKTAIITKFLENHGLTAEDYTIQAPKITDNTVNPYLDHEKMVFNYLAQETVLVRTSKVSVVKEAQADSLKLTGEGVAIQQDYDSKVVYEFTGLNEIKPEMIAEATENARLAAEQFARDSKSKVGKIKKATQGLFSINDAAVGLEEKKNIRVVTTVEYSLK